MQLSRATICLHICEVQPLHRLHAPCCRHAVSRGPAQSRISPFCFNMPRLVLPWLQARSLREAFVEWQEAAQALRARHHAGRQLACHTARGLTQRLFTFWLAVHRARACFRQALLRRALQSWADRTVYKRHQVGGWTLHTMCLAGCILWACLPSNFWSCAHAPDQDWVLAAGGTPEASMGGLACLVRSDTTICTPQALLCCACAGAAPGAGHADFDVGLAGTVLPRLAG